MQREKFMCERECVDLCNNFYNIDLIHRLISSQRSNRISLCVLARTHTHSPIAKPIEFHSFETIISLGHFPFFSFISPSVLLCVLNSFNLHVSHGCVWCDAVLSFITSHRFSRRSRLCNQPHLNIFRIFEMHANALFRVMSDALDVNEERDGKMNWNCLKPALTVSYYYTLCQEWKKVDIISISVIIIIGRRVWF